MKLFKSSLLPNLATLLLVISIVGCSTTNNGITQGETSDPKLNEREELVEEKPETTIITKSARPRSSAGPETVGPVTQKITGTFPEHLTNSLAAVPQLCIAATPSSMSAPDDSTKQSSGIPCS